MSSGLLSRPQYASVYIIWSWTWCHGESFSKSSRISSRDNVPSSPNQSLFNHGVKCNVSTHKASNRHRFSPKTDSRSIWVIGLWRRIEIYLEMPLQQYSTLDVQTRQIFWISATS